MKTEITEKMDRMKIIKRRLSMSLRSARPVDDSLSELAEQMALDEPPTARDNGETYTFLHHSPDWAGEGKSLTEPAQDRIFGYTHTHEHAC
uniref:Uncharacterized protein n=1 Tax=Cyprinodon variegatus TaxID=28743 RepID=A0A3Q2D214_CYPVA